jgi:long-chain acyl-CoA synthetase
MNEMPWLPYYGEMPATIQYPDATLYDVLCSTVRAYPHYTAIHFLGTSIRYRALKREVDAVAKGLLSIGVRPSDRICAILTNSPHAVVLLYAANRIGAVVSYFHPDAGPREIRYFLDDFGPRFAVVTDEHLSGFQGLLPGCEVRAVITTSYADHLSSGAVRKLQLVHGRSGRVDIGIRGVVPVRETPARGDAYELPPTFSWASVRALGAAAEPDSLPDRSTGEIAAVAYTGGTTGTPIGVELGNAQLNAQAFQTQVQGPVLAGQTLLGVAPVSHGYGLGVLVHSALACGARTVLLPDFSARSLTRAIRRTRPEYLVGVPKMYSMLVDDRKFRRTRLAFLMGAFCGGDRCSARVRDRFDAIVRRRGGAVRIREGYGMTETVAACAVMPDEIHRPGSVGIPYPDTLIRVALPTDGAPACTKLIWLSDGEVGEVCVSGPTVMKGYWRRPEETAARLVADDSGRVWLRSGDIGRIDSDGFLYFIQRSGRSCSIDGETVMPGLTEVVLSEHERVKEAIVLADEDTQGVSLTAHVVAVDSDLDEHFLENELRLACAGQLGPHLQPTRFVFHNSLPLTPMGVVDYRQVGSVAVNS